MKKTKLQKNHYQLAQKKSLSFQQFQYPFETNFQHIMAINKSQLVEYINKIKNDEFCIKHNIQFQVKSRLQQGIKHFKHQSHSIIINFICCHQGISSPTCLYFQSNDGWDYKLTYYRNNHKHVKTAVQKKDFRKVQDKIESTNNYQIFIESHQQQSQKQKDQKQKYLQKELQKDSLRHSVKQNHPLNRSRRGMFQAKRKTKPIKRSSIQQSNSTQYIERRQRFKFPQKNQFQKLKYTKNVEQLKTTLRYLQVLKGLQNQLKFSARQNQNSIRVNFQCCSKYFTKPFLHYVKIEGNKFMLKDYYQLHIHMTNGIRNLDQQLDEEYKGQPRQRQANQIKSEGKLEKVEFDKKSKVQKILLSQQKNQIIKKQSNESVIFKQFQKKRRSFSDINPIQQNKQVTQFVQFIKNLKPSTNNASNFFNQIRQNESQKCNISMSVQNRIEENQQSSNQQQQNVKNTRNYQSEKWFMSNKSEEKNIKKIEQVEQNMKQEKYSSLNNFQQNFGVEQLKETQLSQKIMFKFYKFQQKIRNQFRNSNLKNDTSKNSLIEKQINSLMYREQINKQQKKQNNRCINKILQIHGIERYSLVQQSQLDLYPFKFNYQLYINKKQSKHNETTNHFKQDIFYILSVPIMDDSHRKLDELVICYSLNASYMPTLEFFFVMENKNGSKSQCFEDFLQEKVQSDTFQKAFNLFFQSYHINTIKFILTDFNVKIIQKLKKLSIQNKNVSIDYQLNVNAVKQFFQKDFSGHSSNFVQNISQHLKEQGNISELKEAIQSFKQIHREQNQKFDPSVLLKQFHQLTSLLGFSSRKKIKFIGLAFLGQNHFQKLLLVQENKNKNPNQIKIFFNDIQRPINSPFLIIYILTMFDQLQKHNSTCKNTILQMDWFWKIIQAQNYRFVNKVPQTEIQQFDKITSDNCFQIKEIIEKCSRIVVQLLYRLIHLSKQLTIINNACQKKGKIKIIKENQNQQFEIISQIDNFKVCKTSSDTLINIKSQKDVINKRWRCSCEFYILTGLPCEHQILCCLEFKTSILKELCPRYIK